MFLLIFLFILFFLLFLINSSTFYFLVPFIHFSPIPTFIFSSFLLPSSSTISCPLPSPYFLPLLTSSSFSSPFFNFVSFISVSTLFLNFTISVHSSTSCFLSSTLPPFLHSSFVIFLFYPLLFLLFLLPLLLLQQWHKPEDRSLHYEKFLPADLFRLHFSYTDVWQLVVVVPELVIGELLSWGSTFRHKGDKAWVSILK